MHEIDAKNTIITPGFIDCHTHPIFNKNRSNEFYLRSNGKTYKEIADDGGGINNSVISLRETEEKNWEDILEEFEKHKDIDFAYPTERRFNHQSEGKSVIKD